ncbi:hypothetical protein PAU_01562, partial [Photorhabdus asymbiotica]
LGKNLSHCLAILARTLMVDCISGDFNRIRAWNGIVD